MAMADQIVSRQATALMVVGEDFGLRRAGNVFVEQNDIAVAHQLAGQRAVIRAVADQ